MNLKVGDVVWTLTSVLREGQLVEVRPEFVRVDIGSEEIALPKSAVFGTIESALRECVECRDYWERQIARLADLLAAANFPKT